MPNRRLIIVIAAFLTFLLFLQYRLWFDSGGIRDMLKLKQALTKQVAVNDTLKKHNAELTFQIARNHHSVDATEARARNELGMIKEGETFYQIVHDDNGAK